MSGLVPDLEASNKHPKDSSVGPEIVPEASMSPVCILHPVTLWWANYWDGLQYKYLKLLLETKF